MIKISENIDKCKRCNEWIIAEESSMHRCYNRLDTMLFDTDSTYSFDGKKWYRWFSNLPTTNSEQPDKTTEDGTEPKRIQIYHH